MAKFYRRAKKTINPLSVKYLDTIPAHLPQAQINNHKSDKGFHKYKTYDQLVAFIFGQLEKCGTLSDISAGLSISGTLLSDFKLTQNPAKSTRNDGNKNRRFKSIQISLLQARQLP